MGSLFTTNEDLTAKGNLGKPISVPYYLQFVPGYCAEVVHSEQSLRYNGPNSINTIIALPHATDKVYKTRASAGEEYRYYPLLRTMNDVPSKGDPVLLCTIGKIKYYLGPLNTDNNNATWNDDPSFRPDPLFSFGGSDDTLGKVSPRGIRGEGPNFNRDVTYDRMAKRRKEELDYGNAIFETTGDTLIEGRHGNSLRIGSRSNNPYMFISNKRNPSNKFESIGDGSLISITSNGTLRQHFDGLVDDDNNDVEFGLSVDSLTNSSNTIGDVFTDLNGGSDIYLYGSEFQDKEVVNEDGTGTVSTIQKGIDGNQILFHSDRITLNSKLDDIFVSSIKDIHIGAGRHLTFTTAGGDEVNNTDSVIFQTSNFNIGNPSRKDMQQMVLGNDLFDVLQTIVEFMGRLQVLTSLGIQTPLTVGKFAGDISPGEPLAVAIQNEIIPIIETMLSAKHNIESNT